MSIYTFPSGFVLGTDIFDAFMDGNQLTDFAINTTDDQEIVSVFSPLLTFPKKHWPIWPAFSILSANLWLCALRACLKTHSIIRSPVFTTPTCCPTIERNPLAAAGAVADGYKTSLCFHLSR
jgi:hypothetical protein